MPSSSHPVERFSFSTALFGMLVLTLGMGLGRFLYTPMSVSYTHLTLPTT